MTAADATRAPSKVGLTTPAGAAMLAAALGLLCYANAIPQGFVNFDDPLYVTANERVLDGSLAGLLRLWSPADAYAGRYIEFFPLRDSLYWLLIAIFGVVAWPIHLLTAVLHAACAALVVRLAHALRLPLFAAAVAGVLFAVHPVHTESVAWVSALKDPLFTGFALVALIVHTERRGWRVDLLVLGLFVLGALAKGLIIALPLLLLLTERFAMRLGVVDERPWWTSLRRVVPLGVLTAATTVHYLLIGRANNVIAEYPGGTLWTGLLTSAWSIVVYLEKLFVPLGLHARYIVEPVKGPFELRALASVLVLGALTAVAVALRRKQPALAFAWAFYLSALLPVLNIVPKRVEVADRYQYLPTVGALIAIGVLLERVPRRELARAGVVLVTVVFLVLSLARNRVWRDSVALWSDVADQPGAASAPWVWNNLGQASARAGRPEDAIAYYERAIAARDEPHPSMAPAYANLAMHHASRGEHERARAYADLALELHDSEPNPELFRARALVAEARGDRAAAIADLERVVELRPRDGAGWFSLGANRVLAGTDGALLALERAVTVDAKRCGALRSFADKLAERAHPAAASVQGLARARCQQEPGD